jgi:hypothetical protein
MYNIIKENRQEEEISIECALKATREMDEYKRGLSENSKKCKSKSGWENK